MQVNNKRYIAELARCCDITHGNAVVVCHKLEDKGIIFFQKKKNKKIVKLTKQGSLVRTLLYKIKNELKGD